MSGDDATFGYTALIIGYGLAVVLYGGYWLYLRNKTAKYTTILQNTKAR